jgi:hypothetical protein
MLPMIRCACAGLAMALFTAEAPAFADDVERCVAVSADAQRARHRHEISVARDGFIECSSEKCPAIVRSKCAAWLEEVQGIAPSIVIAVNSASGDVPAARITVDGRPVAEGMSITIDPGSHVVAASAENYESASTTFVAREGEKNRTLQLRLTAKAHATPAPVPRPVQPITWLTGGLSLAGLASFAIFGSLGRAEAQKLRDSCAPGCSESQRDSAHTLYLVADISLIAAVVFGGVSAWTYVTRSEQ